MGLRPSRELLRSASKLAVAAAAASLLGACSATHSSSDREAAAAALTAEPDTQDYIGGAAYWGAKFEANREDNNAAITFARNLRMMGGARQAVAVLKDIVMKAPDDPRVLSEYGKALTAAGRTKDAMPFLQRSVQMNGDDWTTLSAYGVALDQSGSHALARDQYHAALKVSPGNPTVESNLAMSFTLEGRLDQAELILRRLVARPDATAQMRQNLGMVAALKGNAIEAEQLAREDLPPSEATNNLAILQQLDGRNARINVQPLAAPPAPKPAAALAPPVHKPMTPIEEKGDAPKASATAETKAVAPAVPTPAVAAAPSTPVAAPAAPAPATPKKVFTMSPIADDAETKTTAAAKPTPLAPARTDKPQTTQATPAATPVAAQPAATKTSSAPDAAAKPATAALRQSYDVYRRPSTVSVANASDN